MSSSTPPGWYPDGRGGQRWWDGAQWTEHVVPPPPSSPPPSAWPASPPATPPARPTPQSWQQPSAYEAWQQPTPRPPQAAPGSRRGLVVGLAVGVVLLLVAGGLAVALVLGSGGDPGTDETGDDPTSETTTDAGAEAEKAAITAAETSVGELLEGAMAGECSALDHLDLPTAVAAGSNLCASQSGIVFFGTLGLQDCELALTGSEVTGDTAEPTAVTVGYSLTGCRDVSRNEDASVAVELDDGQWLIAEVPGFLAP